MVIFAAEFAYRIVLVPRGLRIRYVLANPIVYSSFSSSVPSP
jgi:hypothetical protein